MTLYYEQEQYFSRLYIRVVKKEPKNRHRFCVPRYHISILLICFMMFRRLRSCLASSVVASGSTFTACSPASASPSNLLVEGTDDFNTIIVGGGTAGCTAAYMLAKWYEDYKIPGNVLLIDRGVSYSPQKGPSPKIELWYENWCEYGECHEAVNAKDNSAYPVVPSDHRGLGGCSTHDTRITFQIRQEQKERIAKEMNWSLHQLDKYFQTALNFMPIAPAINKDHPIPFYTAVIDSLTQSQGAGGEALLKRLPDNEHKTGVIIDSIAASSLAMYNEDELRWTPAYLLLDPVRPKNLKILTEAVVDHIMFEKVGAGDELVAKAVQIRIDDKVCVAKVASRFVDGQEVLGSIALTSGAIGNTAILQRSGCGDAKFLKSLNIPVVVDNPSIGHGIDHEEIAVLYEWLEKWNTLEGEVPKGGAMGWPLVIFSSFRPELSSLYGNISPLSSYFQAHFGAGYAEPYTAFPSVVATPNCLRPIHDEEGGYRVFIRSLDPTATCIVKQGNHRRDLETIAQGVYSVANLFEKLKQDGIVGQQLEPPFPVTAENKEILLDWIKENHYTVFHWACTCQAGMYGRVADEHFRLRSNIHSNPNAKGVVRNLYMGSAAALPELSENNPHLTISAFSIALAEEIAKSHAANMRKEYSRMQMLECVRASHGLRKHQASLTDETAERLRDHGIETIIRRPGEERPALLELAREHNSAWENEHQ